MVRLPALLWVTHSKVVTFVIHIHCHTNVVTIVTRVQRQSLCRDTHQECRNNDHLMNLRALNIQLDCSFSVENSYKPVSHGCISDSCNNLGWNIQIQFVEKYALSTIMSIRQFKILIKPRTLCFTSTHMSFQTTLVEKRIYGQEVRFAIVSVDCG